MIRWSSFYFSHISCIFFFFFLIFMYHSPFFEYFTWDFCVYFLSCFHFILLFYTFILYFYFILLFYTSILYFYFTLFFYITLGSRQAFIKKSIYLSPLFIATIPRGAIAASITGGVCGVLNCSMVWFGTMYCLEV